MRDLQKVGDRFVAGEMPSEELPAWAAQALVEGFDSPALRELAGLSRSEVRESRDLMRRALEELAVAIPPDDAGPEDLAIFWASRMKAGTVDPRSGAYAILDQADALGWPEWLDHMYRLSSLGDDWAEGPEHLQTALLAEAEQILTRRRPASP